MSRLFKVIYLNRRQQRRYRCNHYIMREQYRDEGGSGEQQTVNIEVFSFAGFKLFAQKNNTDLFYSKYKSSFVPFAVF